jgi:hypothetical protein
MEADMAIKTTAKSTAKPAARKSTAKPAAKTAAKSAAKSPAKAAAKSPAKPATKRAAKPATKSTAKPAKRTAGNQISKSTRGAASKIAELSRNPLFIEIAAASLVAAAGAMASNKRVRAAAGNAAGKVGAGARDAAVDTAELAGRIGQAVAAALSQATHLLHPGQDDSKPASPSAKGRASTPSKRRAVPLDTKDGAMPYVS